MNHQRPLNKIHNYQIIEGDDDGLISYVFMSSNGAYYSVYFNVKEYDQFTENYPNLFSNGYGLGIFRVTKPVNKIRKDIILFPTIANQVMEGKQQGTNYLPIGFRIQKKKMDLSGIDLKL